MPGIPPSAEFEITLDDPDPFADLPPWKQKIADVVAELAPRYSVNPRLALAVIAVESNFEPTARSPKDARGVMQLIPETAARFNVRDVYNVKDNVRGGLAYLRWLLAYYRGQVPLAAAAYNAGEKAVDRHRGIPPYAETRDYVRRIQRLFRPDLHPYDARIVDPSPVVAHDRPRRLLSPSCAGCEGFAAGVVALLLALGGTAHRRAGARRWHAGHHRARQAVDRGRRHVRAHAFAPVLVSGHRFRRRRRHAGRHQCTRPAGPARRRQDGAGGHPDPAAGWRGRIVPRSEAGRRGPGHRPRAAEDRRSAAAGAAHRRLERQSRKARAS